MKIILILVLIISSFYCTSQVVDSVITYRGDSTLYRSIYNHLGYNTEVSFYRKNGVASYAKWVIEDDTKTMSYFRDDTIYFKTITDDLGDMKVLTNYFLEDTVWELQHTTVCYYSITTHNIEENDIPNIKSNLIVYRNTENSVIIRTANPKNNIELVNVYDSGGHLIKTYENVSTNRLKININIKGLYIINATIRTSKNILIDSLFINKIIIM